MSRFRLALLTAAIGLFAMPLSQVQAEDTAELAKALKDTKVTLQDGLKRASARESRFRRNSRSSTMRCNFRSTR